MNLNHIKAPKRLKQNTLSVMEKENKFKTTRKPMKAALISALILACGSLLTLTAFAYSLFSGINEDNVALYAEYKGNGVVEITIENQARKNLQFDETVKLEQWATNEQIFTLTQGMPVIKPSETAVITIQVPEEYIEQLETPIADTDWYYFLLTTNKFAFGESWMASLTFAESIPTEKTDLSPVPIIQIEDNTSKENISTIKEQFDCQNPLTKIAISFAYNDYKVNGEYAHAELDLVAELGADIYSFSSGTVLETGFDEDLGRYIIIDHSNGLISQYTHCSKILKKQGDIVTLEDVIATVGKTGMATGTHLGFSVTLDNIPINPKSILTLD